MEKRILAAAIKSRKAFEEIFSKIDPDKYSPQGAFIAKAVQEYYSLDKDAQAVDVGVIEGRIEHNLRNDKHGEAIKNYIKDIDFSVSIPNLSPDIRQFKQLRGGDELRLALVNREEH